MCDELLVFASVVGPEKTTNDERARSKKTAVQCKTRRRWLRSMRSWG